MQYSNNFCYQDNRLWLLAGAAILTAPFWLGRNNCCNNQNNSCCPYQQYNYNAYPYQYPQPVPYPYPYLYPTPYPR